MSMQQPRGESAADKSVLRLSSFDPSWMVVDDMEENGATEASKQYTLQYSSAGDTVTFSEADSSDREQPGLGPGTEKMQEGPCSTGDVLLSIKEQDDMQLEDEDCAQRNGAVFSGNEQKEEYLASTEINRAEFNVSGMKETIMETYAIGDCADVIKNSAKSKDELMQNEQIMVGTNVCSSEYRDKREEASKLEDEMTMKLHENGSSVEVINVYCAKESTAEKMIIDMKEVQSHQVENITASHMVLAQIETAKDESEDEGLCIDQGIRDEEYIEKSLHRERESEQTNREASTMGTTRTSTDEESSNIRRESRTDDFANTEVHRQTKLYVEQIIETAKAVISMTHMEEEEESGDNRIMMDRETLVKSITRCEEIKVGAFTNLVDDQDVNGNAGNVTNDQDVNGNAGNVTNDQDVNGNAGNITNEVNNYVLSESGEILTDSILAEMEMTHDKYIISSRDENILMKGAFADSGKFEPDKGYDISDININAKQENAIDDGTGSEKAICIDPSEIPTNDRSGESCSSNVMEDTVVAKDKSEDTKVKKSSWKPWLFALSVGSAFLLYRHFRK